MQAVADSVAVALFNGSELSRGSGTTCDKLFCDVPALRKARADIPDLCVRIDALYTGTCRKCMPAGAPSLLHLDSVHRGAKDWKANLHSFLSGSAGSSGSGSVEF